MVEHEPLRITNVNVFDSIAGRVDGPFDVTVTDGTIASVRPARPGDSVRSGGPGDPGGSRIDGTGKTLIPGLIDAHWHTTFTTIPAAVAGLGESRSLAGAVRRDADPGARLGHSGTARTRSYGMDVASHVARTHRHLACLIVHGRARRWCL